MDDLILDIFYKEIISELNTKKGKIKRGKCMFKIPPFLYIITLLLLVAPQRCHYPFK